MQPPSLCRNSDHCDIRRIIIRNNSSQRPFSIWSYQESIRTFKSNTHHNANKLIMSLPYSGSIPPPLGQTANIVDPPNQTKGTIALHTICLALVTLFVFLRFYTRKFITRELGLDDCEFARSDTLCSCWLLRVDCSLIAWVCSFSVKAWHRSLANQPVKFMTITFSALLLRGMFSHSLDMIWILSLILPGNFYGLGRHLWDVTITNLEQSIKVSNKAISRRHSNMCKLYRISLLGGLFTWHWQQWSSFQFCCFTDVCSPRLSPSHISSMAALFSFASVTLPPSFSQYSSAFLCGRIGMLQRQDIVFPQRASLIFLAPWMSSPIFMFWHCQSRLYGACKWISIANWG